VAVAAEVPIQMVQSRELEAQAVAEQVLVTQQFLLLVLLIQVAAEAAVVVDMLHL
jgi:hypothetical protein